MTSNIQILFQGSSPRLYHMRTFPGHDQLGLVPDQVQIEDLFLLNQPFSYAHVQVPVHIPLSPMKFKMQHSVLEALKSRADVAGKDGMHRTTNNQFGTALETTEF